MKIAFVPVYENNPYQKELIRAIESKGNRVIKASTGTKAFFKTPDVGTVDVVHFHWIDAFFGGKNLISVFVKSSIFLMRLMLFKKRKSYFWTVHNLVGHDSQFPKMEKFMCKLFLRMMDGISVHNQYTIDMLVSDYKVDINKIFLIPHGNYINVYPKATSSKIKELTSQFNFVGKPRVIMFFGQIRPYKGVEILINSFISAQVDNTKLLICGNVKSKSYESTLIKRTENYDNIVLYNHFVSDEDLSSYFEVADVVVFPYKNILTSGALILAMSFKKVCLVSNTGSLPELIGRKFVFATQDDLIHKINEIAEMTDSEINAFGEENYKNVYTNSWDKMGYLTIEMYQKI